MRSFKSSETLGPLASTEICILGFKVMFSASSAKLKKKNNKGWDDTRFVEKTLFETTNVTHIHYMKKNRILYIHISDILYLTISTLASLRQNGFSPPLPSKRLKVETGGERWEPHVAAAQKEINKENLWHRHRQTSYCYQRFTAAVQPASYAGKTESSLYHPYKPVNEGEKIWWICCIFFWLSYAHI